MEKEMLEKLKAYYLGICRIFERAGNTESRTYQESKAVLELVENRERYRWHDLEKDATDLPETKDHVTVEIIVKTNGGGHYYEIVDYHYAAGWRAGHIIASRYIVAWRYIEPYMVPVV